MQKKQSRTSSCYDDDNNNIQKRPPIVPTSLINLISKERFPPSNFIKHCFIILSLSGYLNATDYNNFLDEMTLYYNDCQYHNEEDMDDIINAMESFEDERQTFASSISHLSNKLVLVMNVKKKKQTNYYNNRRRQRNNHDSMMEEEEEEEEEQGLLNSIENGFQSLRDNLTIYKKSLYEQRNQILKCQESILNIHISINSIHNKNDNDQEVGQRYETFFDFDYFKKMKMMNEYKSKFQSLILDLKHQLNWEEIVITKIEDMLINESLYNCIYFDEEEEGEKEEDYQYYCGNSNATKKDSFLSLDTLYQDLMHWSSTIQRCLLLNQKKWTTVKESFVMDVIMQTKNVDILSNDNSKNSIKDLNDKKLIDIVSLITGDDINDNKDCIYIPENDATDFMSSSEIHQNIMNSTSIEETVKIFLEQTLLGTNSTDCESSHSTSINYEITSQAEGNKERPKTIKSSLKMKRSTKDHFNHPLFVLLIGPENSGKTYFCNLIQTFSDNAKGKRSQFF